MKKLWISLTSKQDTVLRELSKTNGISISELIRRAVDDYIEKLIKKKILTIFLSSMTSNTNNNSKYTK